MRAKLISALRFLRVIDEAGQLSLTWVAFVIGAVCLFLARPVSLLALAIFALGLAAYQAKKFRQHTLAKKTLNGANAAALARLQAEKEVTLQAAASDSTATANRLDQLETLIRAEASGELKNAFRKSKLKAQ